MKQILDIQSFLKPLNEKNPDGLTSFLSYMHRTMFLSALCLFSFNTSAEVWKGELARGNSDFISLESLVREISSTDVFLFGEQHNDKDILKLQKQLFDELRINNVPFVLSVEFLSVDQQVTINKYLSNKIDLSEFTNLVELPAHYYPLLSIAKDLPVKVIASNAPQKESSCVYREGLSYINAKDSRVVDTLLPVNKSYQYLIRNKLKTTGMHRDGIDKIVLSQSYKDWVMAQSIAQNYQNQKKLIVHISGATHIEDNHGIYYYLKKENKDLRIKSLVAVPKKEGRAPHFINDYIYQSALEKTAKASHRKRLSNQPCF